MGIFLLMGKRPWKDKALETVWFLLIAQTTIAPSWHSKATGGGGASKRKNETAVALRMSFMAPKPQNASKNATAVGNAEPLTSWKNSKNQKVTLHLYLIKQN